MIHCVQGEHTAILLTFIKLPFVIKIFVLSIFKWRFYTSFTVLCGCLLRSSLAGKALRTLVKSQPRNSASVLEAKPGKLGIKRSEPGILFISLSIGFSLQTGDYDLIIDFHVNSTSSTSFKMCNVTLNRKYNCSEIVNAMAESSKFLKSRTFEIES